MEFTKIGHQIKDLDRKNQIPALIFFCSKEQIISENEFFENNIFMSFSTFLGKKKKKILIHKFQLNY